MSDPGHRNRLADETSPYLLQHAANPVDWYPWGREALDRARRENRPILLSVGYAACHWCHVMERESFEDPATAEVMNEHFVCIKVDREERPDVDDVYMRAVQMMIGHGGWPLTVFLTPGLKPFYGGTYFPPDSRMGMPSFRSVLDGVASAWAERRDEILDVAEQLRAQLQPRPSRSAEAGDAAELLQRAALELHERFDPNHGGFSRAPKFPNATSVSLLLRHAHRTGDDDSLTEAEFSLGQMAAGGIHDQVGGGFHRYSVDARWLVPHFEKMLYDNALLATSYLEAYRISGDPGHARVAGATLDWALREMVTDKGGFAASLDADSEGVEGKFYVWQQRELEDVLEQDAALFCEAYGVREDGNWEGGNILHLPRPLARVAADHGMEEGALRERLADSRRRLLEARSERVRPAIDDKVLADWNGLMIAALAQAHRTLGKERWLEAAVRAAELILGPMSPNGQLHHAYRAGRAGVPAFLDDHAAVLLALEDLFLATFEPRWLEQARGIADRMLEHFADGDALYLTGPRHEELAARPLSGHDGATPSGNGMAVRGLAALAHLTGESDYAERAERIPGAFAQSLRRSPAGFATLILGLDELRARTREIVVVAGKGDGDDALRRLWARYAPAELVLHLDPGAGSRPALEREVPALHGKAAAAGDRSPLFFACRRYTCEAPTTDLDEILGAR